MAGLADYNAENVLNWAAGVLPYPAIGSRFLALFTGAPTSDAGTGGTEVSGTGYARVQVAGALAAGASFTTASTTITLGATAPAWLLALGTNGSGVNVYDVTNGQQIGTVSSISGATVTLTTAAAHASSGAADSIQFSAFPAAGASSGTEPAVTPSSTTNGAVINFAQAGAGGWGTVLAWGLYDAASSGNLIFWDYLGNFAWIATSVSSASPGVFTSHAHGYSVADFLVVSTKFAGSVPTFSQSNFTGPLAVAHAATDTFDVTNGGTAVNTSSTGDVMVRKITEQSIPANVTASFAASNFTLAAA
jgi:hypothetical protein